MAADIAKGTGKRGTEDIEAQVRQIERPHSNLFWLYLLRSLAGLFAAPIVFIPLYFRFHTLRYRFDDEGVSARWGILFRREVHLTYKRIQDIHVHRSLFERWLGIGTVQIQTASGRSQAELSVEGMRDYDSVRDFLYGRMRGHELAGVDAQPASGEEARPVDRAEEGEVVALLGEIRSELEGARLALRGRK